MGSGQVENTGHITDLFTPFLVFIGLFFLLLVVVAYCDDPPNSPQVLATSNRTEP
jgi:hypothetical protein